MTIYSCPQCGHIITVAFSDGKHCSKCGTTLRGLKKAKSVSRTNILAFALTVPCAFIGYVIGGMPGLGVGIAIPVGTTFIIAIVQLLKDIKIWKENL